MIKYSRKINSLEDFEATFDFHCHRQEHRADCANILFTLVDTTSNVIEGRMKLGTLGESNGASDMIKKLFKDKWC